jgi:hypothetical protein
MCYVLVATGRTAQMVRKLMGPDFPIILVDTFLHKNEGIKPKDGTF